MLGRYVLAAVRDRRRLACTATALLGVACAKYERKDDAPLPAQHPPVVSDAATSADATAVDADAWVCPREKTPEQLVAGVALDLFGRAPRDQELALAHDPAFDFETWIDQALSSSESDNGITRFVSNLFRLASITPMDPEDPSDVELASDLRQEPIMLVVRNRHLPWGELFRTRDIYCTVRTARLYNYPVFDVEGFVSCRLPEERAGLLGLASVLRASPSAFYSTNNNYHRVSLTMYLAQGMELLANTNGQQGGRGLPLAPCVPVTDQRVADSGLVFGSAAIPLQGSLCASCHSPYLAPLSVGFRLFDRDGSTLSLEALGRLDGDETLGVSRDQLKLILGEQQSCWSNDGVSPPERFEGQPGIGRLVAASPTLGRALGIQIPQNLANMRAPTDEMMLSVERHFNEGGETLDAALKGFFLSETYRCAESP